VCYHQRNFFDAGIIKMLLYQEWLPLRDYHKAKRLTWTPQDIDFTQDRADWHGMNDSEKELVRCYIIRLNLLHRIA
jgi:ribonucleotide reductase beta subunit family protein with ferritin-like domain